MNRPCQAAPSPWIGPKWRRPQPSLHWAFVGACLGWALAAAGPASFGQIRLEETPSKYYKIHSNLPKDRVHELGRHMDAVFSEYERRFEAFTPRDKSPMPLYLFQSRDQYIGYLRQFEINAQTTGGMFFVAPKGQGLATWVDAQTRDYTLSTLQHEGVSSVRPCIHRAHATGVGERRVG